MHKLPPSPLKAVCDEIVTKFLLCRTWRWRAKGRYCNSIIGHCEWTVSTTKEAVGQPCCVVCNSLQSTLWLLCICICRVCTKDESIFRCLHNLNVCTLIDCCMIIRCSSVSDLSSATRNSVLTTAVFLLFSELWFNDYKTAHYQINSLYSCMSFMPLTVIGQD